MDSRDNQAQATTAHLSLWDAVSIIIGIVIGAGIYESPPFIFQQLSGPWIGLGAWALVGLLALIGALCYAELGTTYPRVGGDYVYLSRAYGSLAGFLFGWAQLAVILTGSIGMLAYIFADYAVQLIPEENRAGFPKFWLALLPVVALTALNMFGVVLGKRAQNVLTAAKVIGLGAVLVAGFLWPQTPNTLLAGGSAPPSAFDFSTFRFALVLIFLTFGGWNDAAYVAAEVRNRRRNIPLALTLGVAAITFIYLLVNAAYLNALGFEGVRQSKAVAAAVLQGPFGETGSRFMSVLVMVSALGAVNGLIFAGSRVYASLGSDYSLLTWLGQWNKRLGAPLWSLLVQGLICAAMIVAVGTPAGHQVLDRLLEGAGGAIDTVLRQVRPEWAGMESVKWEGRSGFELLLKLSAPIFWLFFLLTSLSLFVLRVKDAGLERPFPVPLYPLTPLIFVATCGYMLYSGIDYAGKLGLVGAILLLLGVPLYFLSHKRPGLAGQTVAADDTHITPGRP